MSESRPARGLLAFDRPGRDPHETKPRTSQIVLPRNPDGYGEMALSDHDIACPLIIDPFSLPPVGSPSDVD
jgi:hypothetical protein